MISLYKHLADVWSYEETENEWGQTEVKWVLKYENLKCTFGKKSLSGLTNTDQTQALVRYILHVDMNVDIPKGSKITFKETNQTFKAQFSMPYKFLNKKEIELMEWV